jgi:GT2 family glycosyltransferase
MANRVSIILVNFNGEKDTIECIESILKSDYKNYQIIVVDNSGGEASLHFIQNWLLGKSQHTVETLFPELVFPLQSKPCSVRSFREDEFRALSQAPHENILLVKSNKNSGFAGGNNLAMEYCLRAQSFDFVWLLNNDTVIRKDTLGALVRFTTDSSQRTGVVGSKLFLYHMREKLQAVGGKYVSWFGKIKELGYSEPDNGQWNKLESRFDYVVGASMFIRSEFLNEVGLMEEDYFLYYEEIDWAIRGKKKGWCQAFCPGAIIYHKQGASTGSKRNFNAAISDFYSVRNRILLAKKFFPYTLPTLYLSFGLFIFNRLRLLQLDRIKLFFKVVFNPSRHFEKDPSDLF